MSKTKCELIYKYGDLFANLDHKNTTVIAHVCNDSKAWGAGFVIPLAKKFPLTKKRFLESDLPLGATQFVEVQIEPRIIVANMFGQHNIGADEYGNPPIRYAALVTAMQDVVSLLDIYPDMEIIAPQFGSGLAGGKWDFIETLVKEIWINNGIPVTIYIYKTSR